MNIVIFFPPDKNEYVKGFISYLKITNDYDYFKNNHTEFTDYLLIRAMNSV